MINIESNLIGKKVKATETITTHNGAIYAGTILKVNDIRSEKLMVECPMGKIHWLSKNHITLM
tara:strand:+ start:77 stop:265 length:189 start_codon:yes stop_codon:yes gene_type:complete